MSDPIPLAEEMTDNMALRHLVALTDLMLTELNQDYVRLTGDDSIAVTDALTTIRAEEPLAIKSVIINLGAESFSIYEEDIQIAYLLPNETWDSGKVAGRGALTAKCAENQSSVASVGTYIGTDVAEPLEE